MSDHADIVRTRLKTAGGSVHPALAALDALVAERAELEIDRNDWKRISDEAEFRAESAEAERDEAIACLQRVVEADRDDSRMGHPNAGDSCIGACIGLDVMPWLDQRGKLLPFVPRAALGGSSE